MANLLSKLKETSDYLRQYLEKVEIGLILGSGLGDFVNEIEVSVVIPYNEIPNFPTSTVSGHANRLVFGQVKDKKILVMQGRFHYYEGYELNEVTFPVKVMGCLGVQKLIITNAAGGINLENKPGDLMVITDHINFPGLNPLRGENLNELGPRFPDMTEAYDSELVKLAKKASQSLGFRLNEGVYAWMLGPSYETPAEIKALRFLGADAVGMSTVPEVIVANHANLRVLGISLITNPAAGIIKERLNHNAVITEAKKGAHEFQQLIAKILELI